MCFLILRDKSSLLMSHPPNSIRFLCHERVNHCLVLPLDTLILSEKEREREVKRERERGQEREREVKREREREVKRERERSRERERETDRDRGQEWSIGSRQSQTSALDAAFSLTFFLTALTPDPAAEAAVTVVGVKTGAV
jgi:hypothetical protein